MDGQPVANQGDNQQQQATDAESFKQKTLNMFPRLNELADSKSIAYDLLVYSTETSFYITLAASFLHFDKKSRLTSTYKAAKHRKTGLQAEATLERSSKP